VEKRASSLEITDDERRTLEAWIAARNSPQKIVFRSRIILMAAANSSNRQIARTLKTTRDTVILWRQRFRLRRTSALTEEAPGRGRKRKIDADRVRQIVEAALEGLWRRPDAPFLLHVKIDTFANAYPKLAFGRPITEMGPLAKPTELEGTRFEDGTQFRRE